MNQHTATGILIVGHGSPRAQANEGFVVMVGRIARRMEGVPVLPAFFSIAQPDIPAQVGALASRGITRVLLSPYFLYTGQHVSKDIPALLEGCRAKFPGVTLELLPTLEGEPALEDVVVERLLGHAGLATAAKSLPTEGAAIERRSQEIIGVQLAGRLPDDPSAQAIIRRVVHATADLSFSRTLRIHPQAAAAGIAAMKAARSIVCDVRMVQAGITRSTGEVLCAIDELDVIAAAKAASCTRAAAAMERLADKIDGAIVAIGNAPTALWKVLELAKAGRCRPALVVGTPVGFVGAAESKQALIDSPLVYISNVGPRGGSPIAAAAVNALAKLAAEAKG